MNIPTIGQKAQAIPCNVSIELLPDGSIGLHLAQGIFHAVAPLPLDVARQIAGQLASAIRAVEDVHSAAALANGRSLH